MEESPLNFFGAIGRATSSLFGRRGRNKSRGKGNTLSASQLEGVRRAFGGTKRNTNPINPINTGMVGAGTGVAQPINDAMSMQQEALASVENPTINPTSIQQTQVAQGTGLNTLTQGPSPVNPTDVIQEDASDIYSGAAFGNQAFTKKGSIIPNLIKTKK